jgi:hypothetical protein
MKSCPFCVEEIQDAAFERRSPLPSFRRRHSTIDRIVHPKAHWVLECGAAGKRRRPPSPREFVSGETFRYLGRPYRLSWSASARRLVSRARALRVPDRVAGRSTAAARATGRVVR